MLHEGPFHFRYEVKTKTHQTGSHFQAVQVNNIRKIKQTSEVAVIHSVSRQNKSSTIIKITRHKIENQGF